jgi:hypothetical protein
MRAIYIYHNQFISVVLGYTKTTLPSGSKYFCSPVPMGIISSHTD